MYDLLVVGSGVSGMAAAMYAGRFRLKTAVIGDLPGGIITTTDDVANYPGFKHITGMDLSDKIKDHASEYGVEFITDKVKRVEKSESGFLITTSNKKFESKSVILATGTQWRKLQVPGEEEYANKGVHYCALCDAAFYKDKTVAIIGGSDSAASEALILAQHAKKVFVIYRKDKIRAEPVNLKKLEENEKIEIIINTNVKEIKGEKFVNKVILDNNYNGSDELELDGVFVAIGHVPLASLASELGVKLTEKNEIIIDRDSKTNVEGVFAAGDVVDSKIKQAITGVAEGVRAAYSANSYVKTNK